MNGIFSFIKLVGLQSFERLSVMKVSSVIIENYRSINNITLNFPDKKPIVLFGPNNAGKSNILSAINRILGERYPTYVEMLDSDYYMRDKIQYPTSSIGVVFSSPLYQDRSGKAISQVFVTYGTGDNANENLLHDGFGHKLYLSNEQRALCQSYLIDAERNIQGAFNYSSRYSILSKFSRRIHTALSTEHKQELSEAFEKIKNAFNNTSEFAKFFQEFSKVINGSVKGFVHSLGADFSAYDPNNYAQSLRIYAKENDAVRGFEEFGTGEQQILLMAFIKAYMEVFTSENFVLIIEEPESHLHPLAQKWLKEYLSEMCSSGIQIVISTHSADFIDTDYLEGLVRVYKENGETKIRQLNAEQLCEFCISSGSSPDKTNPQNIISYYSTKLFPDQLKGMLAETILLVEGETEYFSLPIYLKNAGFLLPEHGVEIINCRGKNIIPLFWRLFTAYGYRCYFIFDGDESKGKAQNEIFSGIISVNDWKTLPSDFVVSDDYAYFGKDFEHYFRAVVSNYEDAENQMRIEYGITSKPGIAKAIAQHTEEIPAFILEVKKALMNLSM